MAYALSLARPNSVAPAHGRPNPADCAPPLLFHPTRPPIGAAFRERLRQNPSIVNCCTIDWFMKWPADALAAVALK